MLQLYSHPFSTFSRRVRIALIEKNIPCDVIDLDMAARAHRQPEYLALNPYGRVPTLVDGDFALYESNAILQYLEAIHPEPPLLPDNAKDRALVDMHMRLCDLQMARPASVILFPTRFLPPDRWDQSAIDQARAEIQKHLSILENQLQGKQYLVGEIFSLADISYLPFLWFLDKMKVTPTPAIAAWSERLFSRPSAKQTIPAR